jgi:hypothetical protein
VLAEGGEEDAPLCYIYAYDDHCAYVQRFIEPILTCPITGDLVEDPPADMAMIKARVIEQGRMWFASRSMKTPKEPTRTKKYRNERIIVFDYETCYTAQGDIQPYALGYIMFDAAEHSDADFSKEGANVSQIIRTTGMSFADVSYPLLELIKNAPEDTKYLLVSFNGARFDHFILAAAASNLPGALTNIFPTPGAGIRSLTIYGRHQTLDLAKLMPGMSLKTVCESFSTIPAKMDGFSHVDVQACNERGELDQWLSANRGLLSEYLSRDILSTASLFMKVKNILPTLSGLDDFFNTKAQTIGSHAWHRMAATCPLPMACTTHELDTTVRSYIVGGRVQVYNEDGDNQPAKMIKNGPLVMKDVVSLYPTAMAALDHHVGVFGSGSTWGLYPHGGGECIDDDPIEVTEYVPGKVGIYNVTIHEQPANLPAIVPKRGDTLDWNPKGDFEANVTSIDLELLTRYGGKFTVKSGYTWPHVSRGLFRNYIMPLVELKNRQDELKKAPGKQLPKLGAPAEKESYNPALREMLKLLLNSASGKCCQANYDDVGMIATGSQNQIEAMRSMDETRPITMVPLNGHRVILFGKKKTDKIYSAKHAKPSILAVLIYAYSRAFVWQTLCRNGILYSDTDSGIFTPENGKRVSDEFPQLNPAGRSKQLGDLEDELPEHHEATLYRIAPKDYAIFMRDINGNLIASKVRAKGVRMCDRLVNDDAVSELRKMTVFESSKAYHEASVAMSRPLSDPLVSEEFYARRARGEKVHVFTSQITRIYNDPTKPFTLEQRFMLKEL